MVWGLLFSLAGLEAVKIPFTREFQVVGKDGTILLRKAVHSTTLLSDIANKTKNYLSSSGFHQCFPIDKLPESNFSIQLVNFAIDDRCVTPCDQQQQQPTKKEEAARKEEEEEEE